jgi:NADPH:quinone reductase-like Zn-dependent oxidoreductase
MKAYWIKDSEVEQRDVPEPQPGPGQLRVRVRAAGLNRGEFTAAHGSSTAKPAGGEAAGEVLALGEGVTRWKVGDAVMGRAPGGFAEQVLMDDRETVAKPDRLSWEEAAGVPLTFMVTTDMLFVHGALKPSDWLLVLGASSGVGVACLQAAKAQGTKVIGTSGSTEKLERLTKLGLDVAIHTRAPDFHDRVMEATGGKGANLAVNTVGGTVFAEGVRSLAFQGRLAMVGYVDGSLTTELDLELLHRLRLTLFGVSNRLRSPVQRAEPVPVFVEKVLPALVDGRIRPVVDQVFPFDRLAEAKAMMESNRHLGKIVLAGR